ncbi:hypothetical protein BDZ90DRAFT_263194 [Jaminaea rosea]|uniref:Uncharacterized protein n=1 Tax=Jaminaea rosea TaxID=1569628 RepID=A0A316UHH9_9BASI|nr:hypothetical protein BDZ90DRAFT_263194 [Jaminaea rosea]PWN24650.1 hypothetical protein BDZ90DRAFT_263194 [Jaminaea rosea]
MSARPLLRPLCQPYADLLERSEAYLAAVDLWASRGNAQTLANAVGVGKINVVAALAARSLRTPTYPVSHFQAASGLSPTAFNAALDILTTAISVPTGSSSSSSGPSTPSRYHSRDVPGSSHSTPASAGRGGRIRRAPNLDAPIPLVGHVQRGRTSSSASSPSSSSSQMSLQERAKAVMSGAAFGMSSSPSQQHKSPTTPTRRKLPGSSRPSSSSTSPSARQEKQRPSTNAAPASQQPSPSTPRSHRPVSAAATPTSSVKSTPRHQQRHLYTPSKRSRLGPGEMSDEEKGDEQVGEEAARKRRRVNGSPRKARKSQRSVAELDPYEELASRKLPIMLFPLCPLTAGRGRKASDENKTSRLADEWLQRWSGWLADEDEDILS